MQALSNDLHDGFLLNPALPLPHTLTASANLSGESGLADFLPLAEQLNASDTYTSDSSAIPLGMFYGVSNWKIA